MKLSLSRPLFFAGMALLLLGPIGVARAEDHGVGHHWGWGSHDHGYKGKHHAPEIDANSIGSGLVLLIGSGLLLLEKYRHRV
jgi:hypothetical protein